MPPKKRATSDSPEAGEDKEHGENENNDNAEGNPAPRRSTRVRTVRAKGSDDEENESPKKGKGTKKKSIYADESDKDDSETAYTKPKHKKNEEEAANEPDMRVRKTKGGKEKGKATIPDPFEIVEGANDLMEKDDTILREELIRRGYVKCLALRIPKWMVVSELRRILCKDRSYVYSAASAQSLEPHPVLFGDNESQNASISNPVQFEDVDDMDENRDEEGFNPEEFDETKAKPKEYGSDDILPNGLKKKYNDQLLNYAVTQDFLDSLSNTQLQQIQDEMIKLDSPAQVILKNIIPIMEKREKEAAEMAEKGNQ